MRASMSAFDDFPEKPMPLIEVSDDKATLSINEEAAALLSRVDCVLCPIAIVGLYRTGKSSLLNFLNGKQSGFRVGPSVSRCTRGARPPASFFFDSSPRLAAGVVVGLDLRAAQGGDARGRVAVRGGVAGHGGRRRPRGGRAVRHADLRARDAHVRRPRLQQGRKRVIQRHFNVGVLEAISRRKAFTL